MAFGRMIDDSFYWFLVQMRYRRDEDFRIYDPFWVEFLCWLPPEQRAAPVKAFRERVLGQFFHCGKGRNTEAEVEALAREQIDALADFLGDKTYFFGDRPSAVDAAVYSSLSHAMFVPFPSPIGRYANSKPNLLAYVNRIAAYWAAACEAAPILARCGHGSIVNNASIAGARVGIEFSSEACSAAKAGVLGLTRRLAKRFGPDGVRVNAICPGIIETPRWRAPGTPEPRFARRWRQMAPLGRYGQVDEVASLVLFFASDESSFITGQDLAIDGGFTTAFRFESLDFEPEAG